MRIFFKTDKRQQNIDPTSPENIMRIKILHRHITFKSQDNEKILMASRNKKTYYIQRNNDWKYNKHLIITAYTRQWTSNLDRSIKCHGAQINHAYYTPFPNSSTKDL